MKRVSMAGVANPGTTVDFNFAGSSDLVTQLTQGATAGVFASADTRNMDKAVAAGLVSGESVAFASDTLVIVTEAALAKKFVDLVTSEAGQKVLDKAGFAKP